MMQCSVCGKEMLELKLNPNEAGLEGYIAINKPIPEKGFCSNKCWENQQ